MHVWRLRMPEGERRAVDRGAVREILAEAAGCAPQALVIEREERGKPFIAEPRCGVHFNLSHTDGLALLAVTRVGRVGVDVERIQPRDRWPRIAESWFAPREAAAIGSLEDFLRAWVRKEAIVKLTGQGLAQLRGVEVTVDGPPAVIGADGWALRDVEVPEGWLAAVAVEGALDEVVVRDWG